MNRSRFIWRSLSDAYDSDLLLVRRKDDTDEDIKQHEGEHQLTVLEGQENGGLLPKSVYRFSQEALAIFRKLLRKNQYDYIFLRAVSPGLLAFEAEQASPQSKIVVDSDLVFSQFTKGYWQKDRSFSNRFFLFESLRFRRFERKLSRRPYLFLLANPDGPTGRRLLLRASRFFRMRSPSKSCRLVMLGKRIFSSLGLSILRRTLMPTPF